MTATTSWQPTDTAEVVAALADARAAGQAVEIRGAGSVLDRIPGGDDPTLTTRSLDGIVAHVPEDLIVTVRAGTLVRELAEELARHGQECPIEPTGEDGATVGGRLATALAAPRQLGAGRVRDWLLRVRFVTGDGRSATAGGVTVKDVTGYDLCRLLTGSWGTLGVITEVTLKLRPVPREPRWFATEAPDPGVVERLYRPAAVVTTATRTHVLLEEHPDDTAAQAAAAGLVAAEPPSLPTTARVALDPAAVPSFLADIGRGGTDGTDADATDAGGTGGTDADGTDADGTLTVVTQDQLGLCHLGGPATAIRTAREVAERLGGRLLVLDPALGLPAFGPGHAPGPLSQRVAAALDPDGRLAPWRWER